MNTQPLHADALKTIGAQFPTFVEQFGFFTLASRPKLGDDKILVEHNDQAGKVSYIIPKLATDVDFTRYWKAKWIIETGFLIPLQCCNMPGPPFVMPAPDNSLLAKLATQFPQVFLDYGIFARHNDVILQPGQVQLETAFDHGMAAVTPVSLEDLLPTDMATHFILDGGSIAVTQFTRHLVAPAC